MSAKPIMAIIIRKEYLVFTFLALMLLLIILFILTKTTVPTLSDVSLQGRIVAIDAGHGGIDGGSAHAGLYEKDITLMVSQTLAHRIEELGGAAIPTREDDRDLWDMITVEEEINITKREYEEDLELGRQIDERDRNIALGSRTPPTYRLGLRSRLLHAQNNQAEIMISIHTNHYRSENAKGAVTLYPQHSPESKELAASIQKYMSRILPGRAAPGIVADNFFILRHSKIPVVLVEIGFISNADNRDLMLSDTGQRAIADAIVYGIIDFWSDVEQPAKISYNRN